MGEFETRLVLYEYLRDQAAAIRGAAGWDGDRYMLVDTPAGDVLTWVTVWDSSVDAAEFLDLYASGIARRFCESARSGPATGATRSFRVRNRTVQLVITEIGGRPAVVLTDAAAGAPARIIDLARVTLRE
jgi:hypothetical protein